MLNTLLNEERAIVSSIAGTTRDTIEDQININGVNCRFIDTAGIRNTEDETSATSIFPLAFPLIAGAGTLTTILSLEGAGYMKQDIGIGILLNLVVVFFVLKFSTAIQRRIGKQGAKILEKVFGIILLAIAIKIFTNNIKKV